MAKAIEAWACEHCPVDEPALSEIKRLALRLADAEDSEAKLRGLLERVLNNIFNTSEQVGCPFPCEWFGNVDCEYCIAALLESEILSAIGKDVDDGWQATIRRREAQHREMCHRMEDLDELAVVSKMETVEGGGE